LVFILIAMKSITEFKMPTPEQLRDFKRNIEGRFQLFMVLFKWDHVYRREIWITFLAFTLINYSILDLDSPYDWIALLIEGVIMWIQLGNEFSILPKEYRPHRDGISFGAKAVTSITRNRTTVGFDEILPPAAEAKLKMYNPILDKNIHKETPLCSGLLDDHLMTAKEISYKANENVANYISSVHQIRYLAIRVANKKQHTTNGEKLCLDASPMALMSKDPVSVRKTRYFDGLLTAEAFRSLIISQNLRGASEVSADLTQYYPVEEYTSKGKTQLRLKDDYYKEVSGHIGITSLIFTENRKILMLFQGAGKALDANKIALGGSGSMDFCDAKLRGREDIRKALCRSMAREVAEETGMPDKYPEIIKNTMITGFFHWMDRAGKPEFSGITKAGQIKFMNAANIDGDEILKIEEIPVEVNSLSDFKKVWKYVIDHKLNMSLSSLMALHRMTVIADYNGPKSTKTQKKIYKDFSDFLFA